MPRKLLPLALRKQLESVATPIRKPKNTVLFATGQPCRGAFLIRSGQVELSLDAASHLYPTRLVRTGDVIGLPAAFSGERYSLTARTRTACHFGFIPRQKLRDLLRRDPQTAFDIVRLLSEEIFQMRTVAKHSLRVLAKASRR